MRKLPPLNAVRAFEAAARHISFTKAASELYVTHGAVSKQVSILETWLGAPLFSRTQSQLSLTEVGRNFLAEVTPALDRIAAASMLLRDDGISTALRISAPPTFTMRWLIPRLSGFQRREAEAEIKLTASIAPVNFQDRLYDLAIRGAHEPTLGVNSVPFMTEIIVPVCHVDLLENGRLQSPSDLGNHTLITYSTELVAWTDWLAGLGLTDLRVAGELQFEQMFFALQAALEGLGVVLVPLFLVADEIIAGRLCAPFGLVGASTRHYYANWPLGVTNNPILEGFCEWLIQEGRDTEESIHALSEAIGWSTD